MKSKKELVKEIIYSLINESDKWSFDDYTANKNNISIWITNIPILNISIYRPVETKLNIIQKVMIYKALNICRVNKCVSEFSGVKGKQ